MPASGPVSSPVFAKEPVDQGRLSGIRPADDRHPERLGFVIGGLDLFVLGTFTGNGADIHIRLGNVFRRRERPLLAECGDDRVAQIEHALAVFGRNRAGFTEAEREGVVKAALGAAGLGFVGDDDDGLAPAAQHLGERLICRR